MHASSAAWGAPVGLKRWATPKVSPRCRPRLTESKILSHVDIAHRKGAQPLENQLASGEALVRGKWGGIVSPLSATLNISHHHVLLACLRSSEGPSTVTIAVNTR